MLTPINGLAILLAAVSVHLGSISTRAGVGKPPTGFIDRVYRQADGYEAKYVVFIPHDDDGGQAYPLILYLHGAGQTGTDDHKQIGVGLGPAIRKQENAFKLIAVFPESHRGDWRANSEDGKRALAILDDVRSSCTGPSGSLTSTGGKRPAVFYHNPGINLYRTLCVYSL